jgi:hypothetical protein
MQMLFVRGFMLFLEGALSEIPEHVPREPLNNNMHPSGLLSDAFLKNSHSRVGCGIMPRAQLWVWIFSTTKKLLQKIDHCRNWTGTGGSMAFQ